MFNIEAYITNLIYFFITRSNCLSSNENIDPKSELQLLSCVPDQYRKASKKKPKSKLALQ